MYTYTGVGGGNGDGDGDGAGTGVEAGERAQDENGGGAGTGTEVKIRGRTQDGNGDGSGDENESSSKTGTGSETEKGNGNENGEERGGRRRTLLSPTSGKKSRRHCHSVRGIIIIFVDKSWRLQIASSFGRKTRRLSNGVVPRREQGTRGARKEMVTGTGAGAGTRMEMRVEGRESLGTHEVVIEVGPKMREDGRRQRVTSNLSSCSSKNRRPSETVASC